MHTTLLAYPKINIGLNIYNLRPWETKHRLQSIFVQIKDFVDRIEIAPHSSLEIVHYHHNKKISYERDIVQKAIVYIQQQYHISLNYKIIIHEQIPSGAGLGGSSAAVGKILNYICNVHHIKITKRLLKKIALKVGSDVPFFMLDHKCCMVSGYGHKLTPLNVRLPAYELIPSKTKCQSKVIFAEFDKLHQRLPKNNFKQITNVMPRLKDCIIINNLEPAVFSLYPNLIRTKTQATCLTGSGSYFIKFKE